MLPGRPGGTYFMSLLLQGTSDDQQAEPPARGRTWQLIPGVCLKPTLEIKN